MGKKEPIVHKPSQIDSPAQASESSDNELAHIIKHIRTNIHSILEIRLFQRKSSKHTDKRILRGKGSGRPSSTIPRRVCDFSLFFKPVLYLPCFKICKGQPRAIIYRHSVDRECHMVHAKFQDHCTSSSECSGFMPMFFWNGIYLGHVARPIL